MRGFIATIPPDTEDLTQVEVRTGIYLPAVTVTLRDETTGSDVAQGHTDLSGRYSFPRVANGTYRVCWMLRGFGSECLKDSFTIRDQPMFVKLIQLRPSRDAVLIHGTVRMRSGALRNLEPLAGINAYARVRLLRGQQVIDSALVNTFGDYVLPLPSTRDNVVLEAVTEGLSESRTLVSELLQLVGPSHRVDFVLRNDAPRPELRTLVGGRSVRSAAPGSTIRLQAGGQDINGDALKFHWLLPEGSGTLSASTGQTVNWDLPSSVGLHRVRLIVADGKGGYGSMEAAVSTDPGGVGFFGKVDATDTPVLAGATVDINGVTGTTNAAGLFMLRVREASTYVVNISKPGYSLISRVYVEPVTASRWTSTRGTTVTADPTRPIDVTDVRKNQRCDGPFTSRVAWDSFPEARKPRLVDRFGRVRGFADRSPRQLFVYPKERRCGPGIRVEIPPNSLVDDAGNPPPGNVDVTVHTVDLLSPFDMPGDYTASDAVGRQGVMESYGAGLVEIRSGGKRYNLRPGARATITIPVDPSQLAAPAPEPAQIPLLHYDRVSGVWKTVGQMQLVGATYVGTVAGLSEFNTDLIKQNQSCIKIHSPQTATDFTGLPPSYRMEVTIPLSGGVAPRVIDVEVTNTAPYHVIYNLPSNTDVVLVPYDAAAQKPYGTFIVNSGAAQTPTTPNRPQYPYDACKGQVTLYDPEDPPPGPDAYLHGLYDFGADIVDASPFTAQEWDAATTEYYDRIDPRGFRQTFSGFQGRNGFPTGEVRAKYVNRGDLGFGRDMHCMKKPANDGGVDDVACYVSNYGNQATPDPDDFVNAVNGTGLVATVAMEFSRVENPPSDPAEFTDPDRVVKFFVYNAGGSRVNKADLDGRGARPIPQLCLVCHGGSVGGQGLKGFPDAQSVKLGSRFIAFDLQAFTIVDGVNPTFDKSAQQGAIHQLNQIVKATGPGVPIEQLIDNMYPGGTPPQVETFVVPGWQANAGQQAMYLNVLRPSCRMCHASRPASNTVGLDLRFHQASGLIALGDAVPYRVCTERVMPHALVTHDLMWASISPHQPAQMKAFGDAQVTGGYGPACGAPPVVPPTVNGLTYDTDIASIFAASCDHCHTGPKQPVNRNDACSATAAVAFAQRHSILDLTTANGYNSIVNQPSTELPGMDLVEPGAPAQSYLLHKLEKIHNDLVTLGGCGDLMPYSTGSDQPIAQSNIDKIRDWIAAGALRSP